MTYGFLVALGHVVRLLPDNFVTALAKLLATLFFDLFRVRRKLVLANIATAFPDLEESARIAIGRQSYNHFLLTVFEFVSADATTATKTVSFKGKENLSCLSPTQGGYILCCHMGNWEILSAAVNTSINPTRVIVKKLSNPSAERFVSEQRAAIGMDVIVRKKRLDAVKAIRKAIASGDTIGFVLDQARLGEPRLEFFGRPAKTNTSLASLSQRFRGPIIPVRIERQAYNRHVVEFSPPLSLPELSPDAPPEQGHAEHSLLFNKALEALIRKAPEQYFWLHNRWK